MSISSDSARAATAAGISRCYCLALRQASRRVTQIYDHALAPVGLRGTQLPILSQLAVSGPLTMKALAALMVMDRATLGHNLRPLEAQGLVELRTGEDRRSRLVALTETGRARLDQARGLWRQAQRTFEASFGKEDAAALRGMLGRVAATEFEGAGEGGAGG
jgi:DNA-binding MarR family transcriptional regulator